MLNYKEILQMCGDVENGPAGADGDGGFDGRFCGKFELQFHGRVVEEWLLRLQQCLLN